MTKVDHLDTAEDSMLRYEYDYNDNHQKTQAREYREDALYQTYNYQYDALGRLTSDRLTDTSSDVYWNTYTYDAGGNIQTKWDKKNHPNGPYREYVYDYEDEVEPYQNRLMEYHMSDDATDKAVFTYEGGYTGNIAQKDVYENDSLLETTLYTYRHDSMLATVKVGDNDQVSFSYDAEGRRSTMSVGGVPAYFDYDGGSVLAERTCGYEIDRSYLPGVSTTDQYGETSYYHADAHGSNTMLTDEDGDPAAREVFDAWGNTISVASGGAGRLAYGGNWGYKSDDGYESSSWQEAPVTGGIIQCGVRYYDPDIGRFLQQDPIGLAGGLNLYAYCLNDPINGVDPDGRGVIKAGLSGYLLGPGGGTFGFGIITDDQGGFGCYIDYGGGAGLGYGFGPGIEGGDSSTIGDADTSDPSVEPPVSFVGSVWPLPLPIGGSASTTPGGDFSGFGASVGPGAGGGITRPRTKVWQCPWLGCQLSAAGVALGNAYARARGYGNGYD